MQICGSKRDWRRGHATLCSAIGQAKRGREPLLIRASSKRNPHTSRLEAGPHRPTLAHWMEERGREPPLIRFFSRKGIYSYLRLDAFGHNHQRALDSTTFGVHRWCGCWLWKEKGEGGGRFAVVVGLLLGVV